MANKGHEVLVIPVRCIAVQQISGFRLFSTRFQERSGQTTSTHGHDASAHQILRK